jgi:hypothetical protein
MPLMTMSMTVMTVLHSAEVVHILDSRIPVVQTSTLTHFWDMRYNITAKLFNGFP